MRSPRKPFIVEVKRAGRVSARPSKDLWPALNAAPPEPRQARQDAERAFAAAATLATEGVHATEATGRLLVAQGYRSPLDLRLEQDEQERAGRKRGRPTDAPEVPLVLAEDEVQVLEQPEPDPPVAASDAAEDGAGRAAPTRATGRNAGELPRHMRWMRRLRHHGQHDR